MNIRAILATMTLATIGLLLFTLVSGSIGLTNIFGSMRLHIFLLTVIPLLVVATILSFMIGGVAQKNKSANSRAAKTFSILTSVSALVGLFATKLSTLDIPYNEKRGQFVLENLGTGAIFAAFVFAIILINQQNYTYWPLWGRADKKNADERQLNVRQRVFEKSYRYIIYLTLGSLLLVGFTASRMQKIAPVLIILTVSSMPAIVAAWQKDS